MSLFKRGKPGGGWYLEGYISVGTAWLAEVTPLPFTIGRQKGCHLRLSSTEVSRQHAEIYERDGVLWLREFGGKNGTFVNRQRLQGEQSLASGDILHFGPLEFRIRYEQATVAAPRNDDSLTSFSAQDLPYGFVDCEAQFNEMLHQAAVIPYFQPLIQLSNQQIVAYELLGRGNHKDLPISPWPLLQIAKRLRKDVELSTLFRQVGAQQACQLGLAYPLFVNTVSDEIDVPRLQLALQALRQQAPSLSLVLEIHETTVADLGVIRSLRALLDELNIPLAYDDFGAGQARLVELMTVPPDYLKFDKALIQQIHHQPPQVQQALQALVHMAQNLGIRTVAEGVEVKEELDACIYLGFDLAQGYYLGRPAPDLQSATF